MAEMSDFRRAQVGCVAVIGNRVVATGFSQQRTHPMQDYYNQFRDFRGQKDVCAKLHAEMAMLISVQHLSGINWSKAHVYIYRLCRSRPAGISKPCPACTAALASVGVRHVHYTTNDGFAHIKIA